VCRVLVGEEVEHEGGRAGAARRCGERAAGKRYDERGEGLSR